MPKHNKAERAILKDAKRNKIYNPEQIYRQLKTIPTLKMTMPCTGNFAEYKLTEIYAYYGLLIDMHIAQVRRGMIDEVKFKELVKILMGSGTVKVLSTLKDNQRTR
jgi:hypothetical protein